MAGVTAQRVGQWCRDEGLDWRAKRTEYVNRLWVKALRQVRTGRKMRHLTKAMMRKQAERAKAQFDKSDSASH